MLTRYYRQAPATAIIIAVCTVVYVVTAFQARSLSTVAGSQLADSTILWAPLAAGTQFGFLRLVTNAFLHLDVGHLAINMFMLALIGREVEQFLGTALYSASYLAGILGSSAAIVWMAPSSPTAGASGALFTVMTIYIATVARRGGDLRAPIVLVAVNLAYTFISPEVSLWGHLGGFITGLVACWPLTSAFSRTRWITSVTVLLVAVLLAGTRLTLISF